VKAIFFNKNYELDPEKDEKGPNYLGAAIWGKTDTPGKLVVFGDADWLTNLQIKNPANLLLAENCLRFLEDKKSVLAIPVKETGYWSLTLSRSQMLWAFVLGTLFPPLAILILGYLSLRKRGS